MGFAHINQGKDATIEPAYLARRPMLNDQSIIEQLAQAVAELQRIVEGTESAQYKDGLVEKVAALEIAVQELIISSDAKVFYRSTAEHDAETTPSIRGAIYVYYDAILLDGQYVPRLKVGNGVNLIKDMYFTDQDIVNSLSHITTVTQEEKDTWNNKVSCTLNPMNENLIFSTS